MTTAQRFQRLSLRWQICALTVIALALSLLVMGFATYLRSSQLARGLTLDKVVAETDDAVELVEGVLNRARVYTATTPWARWDTCAVKSNRLLKASSRSRNAHKRSARSLQPSTISRNKPTSSR